MTSPSTLSRDMLEASPHRNKQAVAMFTPETRRHPTLSPHLVTDRITRSASPMRYPPISGEYTACQSYYTSFSAVSSPASHSSKSSVANQSKKHASSSFDRRNDPKFATAPTASRISRSKHSHDSGKKDGQVVKLSTSTSVETADSVFTPGTPVTPSHGELSSQSERSQSDVLSEDCSSRERNVTLESSTTSDDSKQEGKMVIYKSYEHHIVFDLKQLYKDKKRGRLPEASTETEQLKEHLQKTLESQGDPEEESAFQRGGKNRRSFTSSLTRLVRTLRGHGGKEKAKKKKQKQMSRSTDILGNNSYVESMSSAFETSDYPSVTSEASGDFELQAQIAALSASAAKGNVTSQNVSAIGLSSAHSDKTNVQLTSTPKQFSTLPLDSARKLKAIEGFSSDDKYRTFKERQVPPGKRENVKAGAPLSTPTHHAATTAANEGETEEAEGKEQNGSVPQNSLQQNNGNGIHEESLKKNNSDYTHKSLTKEPNDFPEDSNRKPPSYVKLSCAASGYSSGFRYPSSNRPASPLLVSPAPSPPQKPTDEDDPRLKNYIPYGKNFVKGISQKFEQLGVSNSPSPVAKQNISKSYDSLKSSPGSRSADILFSTDRTDSSPFKDSFVNASSSSTQLTGNSDNVANVSVKSSEQLESSCHRNDTGFVSQATVDPADSSLDSECKPSKLDAASSDTNKSNNCSRAAAMQALMNGDEGVRARQLVNDTGYAIDQAEACGSSANVSSSCSEDTLSIGKSLGSSAGSLDYLETDVKDGQYYLQVTNRAEEKFSALCKQAEEDLQLVVSEEICGKLRAAIGKTQLLTSKKFKQFRGLCEQNITPVEDQPKTTCEDLGGFWDMVQIQVDEVDDLFQEIQLLRDNGWKKIDSQAMPPPRSRSTPSTPRTSRVHRSTPKSNSSSRSARSVESRKRLQEAKRAARERMQKAQQAKGGEPSSDNVVILDSREGK